nr:MAG TPA: hypothetical protein [Caudoviricetes sp.]
MLMEDVKIYVIVKNQEPHFLFERIEDYSSMRGYLAKAHPLYTHRFTKYVEKAMHFLTIKEALDFIQAHQIDGSIIKDLSQERLKRRKMSKQYHEDYGDVITFIYSVIGNSSDKMLQAAHDMHTSVTSLSKFMRDPYSISSQTRDKIVANITRLKKED